MSVDQLPAELVYAILDLAPTPDVVSFAQTSSSYRQVADLVLRKRYERTYGVPVSPGRSAVDQYRLVDRLASLDPGGSAMSQTQMVMNRDDVATVRKIADAFREWAESGQADRTVYGFEPGLAGSGRDDDSERDDYFERDETDESEDGIDDYERKDVEVGGSEIGEVEIGGIEVDYASDRVRATLSGTDDRFVEDPDRLSRLLSRAGPGWTRAVELALASKDEIAFAPGLRIGRVRSVFSPASWSYESRRRLEVGHVVGIQFGSDGQTLLFVRLSDRTVAVDTDYISSFP